MVWLKIGKDIFWTKTSHICLLDRIFDGFRAMGFNKGTANPCLYFKNMSDGLIISISWVNNYLLIGNPIQVCEYQQKVNGKYVECRIMTNMDEGYMKITQPVLIKNYEFYF